MINYAVLHFCPSPKKHVYMHDELLLCSWRPTMSEEGALSVRFREPKTEEEEDAFTGIYVLCLLTDSGESCPLFNKV